MNDLQIRLDKAYKLKQDDIKTFDKYLFNYCSLKAKNNINKDDVKLSAFWSIALSIIAYIDSTKIYDVSTIENFIQQLENTVKAGKYENIDYLYVIIFEFIQEHIERM